jgi:hypothetical protein
LKKEFWVKNAGSKHAAYGVESPGVFWQNGCAGKRMRQHAGIGDYQVVVATRASEAWQDNVFIGVKVDSESGRDARVVTLIGKALIKPHA